MSSSTVDRAESFIDRVIFDDRGLVPVIVQQVDTREVLMMAWMNHDAIHMTLDSGRATYWSRSRSEIWVKGATSGSTQRVISLSADCDYDTLLLVVDQVGQACHTGSRSCFDTFTTHPEGAR